MTHTARFSRPPFGEEPLLVWRALVCLAGMAAGYGLNLLQVPVFGGTALVFGGLFSVLAAIAYGPWWGGLTAAGAYLSTVAAWGHPYGLIVFTLEAWTIGWLMHRHRRSLLTATAFYWIVGAPLTYVCIFALLRPPQPHGWAMTVKYVANGFLVYLPAQLVILAPRFWRLPGIDPRRRPRGELLRTHLLRRFMVIAAVPGAVFAICLAFVVNRQYREDARARLIQDTAQITDIISRYVRQHATAVELTAGALEGGAPSPAQLDELLARMRAKHPGFLTMLVADETGLIVAASPVEGLRSASPRGLSVADRDYFRQAEPLGPAYVSPVFLGRGFGHDLIIAVSAGWRDAAGHRHILEGSLDLARMRDEITRTPAVAGTDVLVLDPRGQIIFQRGFGEDFTTADLHRLPPSHDREVLVMDDSSRTQNGGYVRHLGLWRTVPGADWRVYLREDVWVSEAPVARYILYAALGLAATLLLALGLARATAARFSQPFQDLVEHARALLGKQPGPRTRPPDEGVPLEWRRLAAELHDMAGQLAQANAGLERALRERDRSNEELRLLNQELDRRVQARTAELDEARQRAERASSAKSAFLATVSHELRTPLNVALGHLYLLQHRTSAPLNAVQADRVARIKASAEQLLALINEILDLAKLEADRLELRPEPFDAGPLGQECADFFREEFARSRLTFTVEPHLAAGRLTADRGRVRQILLNLISNAVKFTPEGGRAGLVLTEDGAAGLMHFAVWDTGIGFSEEQRGKLFQPFGQLDSSLARKFSGTGLGLSIVQRLVHLHAGTVTVESTPGTGSRFTVSLPLAPPVPPDQPPP